MKNGQDDGWDDPKVTPITAGRRRRDAGRNRTNHRHSGGTLGQWIFGGVLIAMAVGMILTWSRTLLDAASSLAR